MRRIAYLLSLFFIFTIPWEDAFTISELGTFSRVIGMVTAAVWLISVLISGSFRKLQLFHLFLLLFFLWNLSSFYWTLGIDETLQRIKTYFQLIVFSLILWDLYTTRMALRTALHAYVLGAYIAVGSTINNFISGRTISDYSIERYTGANLNANTLALILAIGIPIAWHLATTSSMSVRGRLLSIVNFVYIGIAFFSILLAGSRMAVLAIIPAFIFITWSVQQIKPLYRFAIVGGLSGIIIQLYAHIPQSTLDRLATLDDSILALDLGGRGSLWVACIQVFLEHPLLGVGSGAIRTIPKIGTAAHNSFLSVLSELGLVGLVIFFVVLAIVLVKALIQPKPLSWLWCTVLFVWCIGASTLSWEFKKSTWLLLSFVIVSAGLFEKSSSEDAPLSDNT